MTPEELALEGAVMIVRPLAQKLAPVAAQFPDVAEAVVKILTRTVEMVARSGRPGDVDVWQRACMAAASEYTSEKSAEEWLSLDLVERP